MVCHQIRLRGDDSFFLLAAKKEQEILCSRMWVWIFLYQMMHSSVA